MMKKRCEVLKRKIDGYLKKEQLFKDEEHKKLERPFLTKSRKKLFLCHPAHRFSKAILI